MVPTIKRGQGPLREVLVTGVGWDSERPHTDVDLLVCGHALTGAQDRIGRRYPAKRRCNKCASGKPPHIDDATMVEARQRAFEGGTWGTGNER